MLLYHEINLPNKYLKKIIEKLFFIEIIIGCVLYRRFFNRVLSSAERWNAEVDIIYHLHLEGFDAAGIKRTVNFSK